MTSRNFDRRPDPDALLAVAGSGGARQAQDLSRRRARRRQDLCDAAARPRAEGRRRRRRRRPGRDPRTRGNRRSARRAGGSAAPQGRLSRPRDRGIRHRRGAGAQAQADRRRRTRPHQCARTAATPSAGRTSRNCSTPASTSGPRSMSSIWRASPTWSRASPACACARPCPTPCSKSADDVVLVDITPDELIQRLHEGKVYLPADRAARGQTFLQAGNLTALRELALAPHRRPRRRPDGRLSAPERRSKARGRPPSACGLRRRGCLFGSVVRAASRLATPSTRTGPRFTSSRRRRGDGRRGEAPASTKRCGSPSGLAQRRRGFPPAISPGELLRFARRENFTQIVFGRSRVGFFAGLSGRTLTQELVRRSRDVAVHIVTDQSAPPAERRGVTPPSPLSLARGVGAAALSVAAAVGAGLLLERWLHLPNLSMIFLVAVIFCALRFGLWSAIAAAVLSFFAFDFFLSSRS